MVPKYPLTCNVMWKINTLLVGPKVSLTQRFPLYYTVLTYVCIILLFTWLNATASISLMSRFCVAFILWQLLLKEESYISICSFKV